MARWQVAGMHAQEACQILREALGGAADVQPTSDLEGVQAVLNGEADLYVGICATGAGGALAMAQVLAGPDRCITVDQGSVPASIDEALQRGVICFGIPSGQLRSALALLASAFRTNR